MSNNAPAFLPTRKSAPVVYFDCRRHAIVCRWGEPKTVYWQGNRRTIFKERWLNCPITKRGHIRASDRRKLASYPYYFRLIERLGRHLQSNAKIPEALSPPCVVCGCREDVLVHYCFRTKNLTPLCRDHFQPQHG